MNKRRRPKKFVLIKYGRNNLELINIEKEEMDSIWNTNGELPKDFYILNNKLYVKYSIDEGTIEEHDYVDYITFIGKVLYEGNKLNFKYCDKEIVK